MIPPGCQIDGRTSARLNPYDARLADESPPKQAAEAGSFRPWRTYLFIHLAVVVAAGLMMINASMVATRPASNLPREFDAPLWLFNAAFLLAAAWNAYVSPVLVVVLLAKACQINWRYGLAALAEALLAIAFFFFVIPAVQ